jgi:ribose/xylose/arabinose/galactoside ABC-type transport system permease subunit
MAFVALGVAAVCLTLQFGLSITRFASRADVVMATLRKAPAASAVTAVAGRDTNRVNSALAGPATSQVVKQRG